MSTRQKSFVLLAILAILGSAGPHLPRLGALSAKLESVEIWVILHDDGKAEVRNSLSWNVTSGTMGEAAIPPKRIVKVL